MAKKITVTRNQSYGSHGWIEGKEEIEVPQTILTSESTGKTIALTGHKDHYTAQEIRSAIAQNYSKDYKREFCQRSNKDLENDFK